jgi:hypothetical protein
MTDETTETTSTDVTPPQNINIGMEQICAAILATVGNVTIPMATLISDYTGKSIAVNQDETTKDITLSLADAPATEVVDNSTTENE